MTAEDGTTSEEIAVTVYGEKLQWISGEKAKEIKGLPAGDYILREIAAPTGYTIAKDVEFTVSNDRKVTNKAVMEDQATEVKISKVDITDAEKELPGATLQVMDKYGNEIVKTVYGEELKWVSGNEAKVIKGLDQPFLVQYGKWLKGMLTGNLGESYVSHQDVAASFAAKLPATLLLADEPTSALDVTVQKQVVEKLLELRKEEGTAMAVVTHNIGVVRAMADQVLVLKEGCMVEYGRLEEVLEHPKEAYTRQLLSSALTLQRAKEEGEGR